MDNTESSNYTVTIHQSLTRPQLWLGCDRELFLCLIMLAVFLIGPFGVMKGNFFAIPIGLFVWVIGQLALVRMAKNDPFTRQIFMRSLRYKDFYTATAYADTLEIESFNHGRGNAKSTAGLLPYEALISPQIILLKDGSLLGGFQYRGADLSTAPMRERATIAQHTNNVLKRLGDGYCLHFEAIRIPTTVYPGGHFTETVTKIIDRERKKQYQSQDSHHETVTYCFITWQPKNLADAATSRFVSLFNKKKNHDVPASFSEHQRQNFETTLDDIANSLSSYFTVEILKNEDFLNAINLCVNGESKLIMPEVPWALDTLLARDIENGDPFIFNNEFVSVLSIDGFPADSIPSILMQLGQLAFSYRWSSRYIPMDFKSAYAKMSKEQKKWAQKELPAMAQLFDRPTSKINKDAVMQGEDVNNALSQLHQGQISFGHYTGTVVIRDKDYSELSRKTREAIRCLEESLFSVKLEHRNTIEAFLGSMPGDSYENIRKPLLHSLNYAHFLLLSSAWPGLKENPCPMYPPHSPALVQSASGGGNPFRLHLHVSDVGHTLIIGPPGSGKSTLLATIAAQFDRYANSQMFIFDKGRSIFPLVAAMKNANFYELGNDAEESPKLCPLSCLDSSSDLTWANEYVENLVLLNGGTINPAKRKEISDTILAMASGTSKAEERSMTYLQINLQDQELKDTLLPYTQNGPYGKYLDGAETDIKYNKVTAFELEELMRLGEKVTTPVLLYLFHEIEKRLDGRPTLIILDEAWLMLANKLFAGQLKEWLKVLRKANAAVVMATQSLTDILNSDIKSAILESPTKIMLPNSEAKSDTMKKLYIEQLRLTETEVETIATATPKRDYFYISPLGRRLFRLNMGPLQLAFLGSSSKDDLKEIEKLKEEHNGEWPYFWLKEKKLPEWANYWNQLEGGGNDEETA